MCFINLYVYYYYYQGLILPWNNKGDCLLAPKSLPWCLWNAPVKIYNFLIGCPSPRRNALVPLPFQKWSMCRLVLTWLDSNKDNTSRVSGNFSMAYVWTLLPSSTVICSIVLPSTCSRDLFYTTLFINHVLIKIKSAQCTIRKIMYYMHHPIVHTCPIWTLDLAERVFCFYILTWGSHFQ